MGIYGGLLPEDAKKWGQFTTFKTNAPELVSRSVAAGQVIYCSPLVDPYQPAEREHALMPGILARLIRNPPSVFVIQTRGPLILRDLVLLEELAARTKLRISFSITTDCDDVRRRYEPHCESNIERLETIRVLRSYGFEVYATLAPLLPSNPSRLAALSIEAAQRTLIGDPLHVRQTKPHGATTRAVALEIARRFQETDWFRPEFQRDVVETITETARAAGYDFVVGPAGFGLLAEMKSQELLSAADVRR